MFVYGAPSSRCAGTGGLRRRGRTEWGRLSCYHFTGPWSPSCCVLLRRVNQPWYSAALPTSFAAVSLAPLLYRLAGTRPIQPATLFVCDVRRPRLPKQAMRRSNAQPATTSLISPLLDPPASSTFFALKQASALSNSSP
jgi:hypothetical protein